MAVVKEGKRDVEKVNVDGSELEEVDNLRYLGTRIQSDGDVSKEVKSRLSMGLKALNDMKKLWQVQDKETKLRVLTACIFPIPTYACEVWILWKVDGNRITAFENKYSCRILRVPWAQGRTNEDVRKELDVSSEWLLQ